jgi:hypothetical protein
MKITKSYKKKQGKKSFEQIMIKELRKKKVETIQRQQKGYKQSTNNPLKNEKIKNPDKKNCQPRINKKTNTVNQTTTKNRKKTKKHSQFKTTHTKQISKNQKITKTKQFSRKIKKFLAHGLTYI